MYNFSYETKPIIRDILVSIKLNLDRYLCIAQTACIAQKINMRNQIGEAYMTACDYIANKYDVQMTYSDKYCYPVKNTVSGDLYLAKCEATFSNIGNNPNFNGKFILMNNITYDGYEIKGTDVNVNQINFLDYSSIRAINTRYKILKTTGVTKQNTLIHYLASNGIVTNDAINTAYKCFDSGRSVNRYGRILTSYQIRDLNDSDNIKFTCYRYGNAYGYYFNRGQEYKYRYTDSNVEAKYWSGKLAYGDIVSCETGELDSSKVVSAYARYSESHWYWSDDEHWSFVNDVFGETFFILQVGK